MEINGSVDYFAARFGDIRDLMAVWTCWGFTECIFALEVCDCSDESCGCCALFLESA